MVRGIPAPDGTVTRRDTGLEDVSRGALRTGVPVTARDTGYFDGVFPRADPGAWHAPADMFTGAAFFYTAALAASSGWGSSGGDATAMTMTGTSPQHRRLRGTWTYPPSTPDAGMLPVPDARTG